MVAPCKPERGQSQVAREVDIKLSGPAHCDDVAEENPEQAEAMVGDDDGRVDEHATEKYN